MMNREQSLALVKEAWAAFASRDPERIRAVFTEDAEWLAPPMNATATALDAPSHMIGSAAIIHFITTDMERLFRKVSVDFRGFYADGGRVIVEERMTATLSNGASYVNDYCFVFECEDGRIRRVREYMDTWRGHDQIYARGHPLKP